MRHLFLTMFLVAAFSILSPAGPAGAAYPTPSGTNIDDGRQVYMGWYESNWEIFMHDITSSEITRVTNEPYTQGYPDIWGNYIVWQDNRDNPGSELGGFSIYLYDINTQNTQKISPATGNSHQEPQIADGKVIWIGYDFGQRDIYLYDTDTKSTKIITSTLTNPTGLKFDGQTAAWVDFRNGGNDLYLYNSATDREKQVTSGQDIGYLLAVDGGRVAWAEKVNGHYQIKLHHPATGETVTLTSAASDHLPRSMSGNNLLISSDNGLVLQDTVTGTITPVKTGISNPDQVILQGDQLICIKGGQTTSEPLSAAAARAGGSPDSGASGSSTTASIETVTDSITVTVISSRQQTIVSPDGQAVFSFAPGTFNSNVELTLQQSKALITGFIPVTPIYTPAVEGTSVQKPVQLTISFTLPEGQTDYRKAALYTLQGDTWSYLPFTRDENILTTQLQTLAPVAVLIKPVNYEDLAGHWSSSDVEVLASHGIVNGFNDHTLRPNQKITRAEFVAILANCDRLSSPAQDSPGFADVPAEHLWLRL